MPGKPGLSVVNLPEPRSFFGYFGVTMGSLGLSTEDFLLKSVAALYVPLGLLLPLALLGAWGRPLVRRQLQSRTRDVRWRIGAIVVMVCGALLFACGLAGVVFPGISRSEPIATTPVCLGMGLGAVAYARHLLGALMPSGRRRGRRWTEPLELTAVLGLVVLSTFWAANSFAAAYGTGRGEQLAERLSNRPAVVVDTTERLHADDDCLEENALPVTADQRFRYRYLGLRLLAESGGRLFLLPEGWESGSGAVLVVSADSNVRLQFYRGGAIPEMCHP